MKHNFLNLFKKAFFVVFVVTCIFGDSLVFAAGAPTINSVTVSSGLVAPGATINAIVVGTVHDSSPQKQWGSTGWLTGK